MRRLSERLYLIILDRRAGFRGWFREKLFENKDGGFKGAVPERRRTEDGGGSTTSDIGNLELPFPFPFPFPFRMIDLRFPGHSESRSAPGLLDSTIQGLKLEA